MAKLAQLAQSEAQHDIEAALKVGHLQLSGFLRLTDMQARTDIEAPANPVEYMAAELIDSREAQQQAQRTARDQKLEMPLRTARKAFAGAQALQIRQKAASD